MSIIPADALARAHRGEMLTPEEAAAVLRVSLDTIYRLYRDGHLEGRRVGRRLIRITAQSVVARAGISDRRIQRKRP